jgi:hypothetical protein
MIQATAEDELRKVDEPARAEPAGVRWVTSKAGPRALSDSSQ